MGTILGVPYDKDCSIWGSILGSHYFGKLPYVGMFFSSPLDSINTKPSNVLGSNGFNLGVRALVCIFRITLKES